MTVEPVTVAIVTVVIVTVVTVTVVTQVIVTVVTVLIVKVVIVTAVTVEIFTVAIVTYFSKNNLKPQQLMRCVQGSFSQSCDVLDDPGKHRAAAVQNVAAIPNSAAGS